MAHPTKLGTRNLWAVGLLVENCDSTISKYNVIMKSDRDQFKRWAVPTVETKPVLLWLAPQ